MIFAVAGVVGHLTFSLPAAADVSAWCAVIKDGDHGIASIARWKSAGLMSWEAIAVGVVRTRISLLRRQNLEARGNIALPRNRHPILTGGNPLPANP